jgi:DNA-directed RNA polymerase subunit M/transcription elongation factor TFIIS
MKLGRGNKTRVKCPLCSQAVSVYLERSTAMQAWQIYECTKCDLKFRLPRGWRKKWLERSTR